MLPTNKHNMCQNHRAEEKIFSCMEKRISRQENVPAAKSGKGVCRRMPPARGKAAV